MIFSAAQHKNEQYNKQRGKQETQPGGLQLTSREEQHQLPSWDYRLDQTWLFKFLQLQLLLNRQWAWFVFFTLLFQTRYNLTHYVVIKFGLLKNINNATTNYHETWSCVTNQQIAWYIWDINLGGCCHCANLVFCIFSINFKENKIWD